MLICLCLHILFARESPPNQGSLLGGLRFLAPLRSCDGVWLPLLHSLCFSSPPANWVRATSRSPPVAQPLRCIEENPGTQQSSDIFRAQRSSSEPLRPICVSSPSLYPAMFRTTRKLAASIQPIRAPLLPRKSRGELHRTVTSRPADALGRRLERSPWWAPLSAFSSTRDNQASDSVQHCEGTTARPPGLINVCERFSPIKKSSSSATKAVANGSLSTPPTHGNGTQTP